MDPRTNKHRTPDSGCLVLVVGVVLLILSVAGMAALRVFA